MWIPYDIRASLKAECSRDAVNMSQADTARREFLIGFFLRNPVTQVWELDLVAAEGMDEIAIPDLPGARFSVFPNEAGKLAEVIYRLPATSVAHALAAAHDDFQRRLLRWMAEIGRGMSIAGWRVADMTHDARWRCTPFRPSAMQVHYDALVPVDRDLAPIVELFQRARNAPDAASRLMAGYAVLVAATSHAAMQDCGATDLRVTKDLLVHSGAIALPDLTEGASLSDLIAFLRPDHDRLIGPGGVLIPLQDDLPSLQRLALLANLADLTAHRLILAEIRARKAKRALTERVAAPAES